MAAMPLQLGVLASGEGTNLQSIIDAASERRLDAEIRVVVSNRSGSGALARAQRAGIPGLVVPHRGFGTREAFEDAMVEALRLHGVEWVALAGFMRVLTQRFLSAFPERVVNMHPALLPAFPGVDAQRQAWEHGVKFAGCTVHFVDAGVDTGPIIGQAVVPVLDTDDAETLRIRILEQEHLLYPRVLQLVAEGRVLRDGRRTRVARRCPP